VKRRLARVADIADRAPRTDAEVSGSGILELRRYALRTGMREALIELSERELVGTHEAVGLRILGTSAGVSSGGNCDTGHAAAGANHSAGQAPVSGSASGRQESS
jgi:hypothetical protein